MLKVLYRLAGSGHIAYLVGGGVRDLMLSRRPKDFDVGTSAHPQQVRDLFRNSRLIGRRFRLVHVFFGQQNIEVATFRRPSEELGDSSDPLIRHDNTFGTPEEDAFRRDFTVNSLFYDPQTFHVIDYTGGVDDLKAGLIRSIGDPDLRMREDPVRMMRAVRFAAKLGFEIEPATRSAIERHREDLLKASVPRLVEETYRTIGQPEAARAVVLMDELGLLEPLLPFLSAHLKRTSSSEGEPAPTLKNLQALGRAFEGGLAPDHSMMLAAMFLDHVQAQAGDTEETRFDLLGALRQRGFARGDTENMRLLLDAFALLTTPSRRTRRLMRRPYFNDARRLFEMCAPTYGIDDTLLRRFIADPDSILMRPQAPEGANGGRRKRRRRRRRRHGPPSALAVNDSNMNGAAQNGSNHRELHSAGPHEGVGSEHHRDTSGPAESVSASAPDPHRRD